MSSSARKIRTLAIADRTYDLWVKPCSICGKDAYSVIRTSGMTYSIYKQGHVDAEDFEELCKEIDDDFLRRAPELANDFRQDLQEINSVDGIEADATLEFRLLEYGRTRFLRLRQLGAEAALFDDSESLPLRTAAIQAAFELGFAAGQHSINKQTEEYFWEGWQAVEARQAGQERAKLALARKGKKTRAALALAAEEVRRLRPEIAHNIAEVAREIQRLGLMDLSSIKHDTICKYLREARKNNKPENRQINPQSGKTSR